MLHILLLILKIIGWILLAILGILVLLSCIVIFTPFRYELKGKCNGTLKSLGGGVTFSYFLHLISGSVQYADERVSWKLRVAWKKMGSEETAEEIEKTVADEAAQAVEAVTEAAEAVTETSETVTEAVEETEEHSETVDEKRTTEAEDGVEPARENETNFPITDFSAEENADKAELNSEKDTDTSESVHKKVNNENLIDKLDKVFQKISCKFAEICDKIKELIRKKELIMDFLTNEIHTAAFKRVILELKRLARKMKPKKLKGSLEFGFENPALTGKVLAGISMLYPYLADNVEVNPRFEEKILKGDIYIKGSVAARLFASMGLRLLLDKNIRTTLRHAKKFKL